MFTLGTLQHLTQKSNGSSIPSDYEQIVMSASDYEALVSKDPNTFYLIKTNENRVITISKIYKGSEIWWEQTFDSTVMNIELNETNTTSIFDGVLPYEEGNTLGSFTDFYSIEESTTLTITGEAHIVLHYYDEFSQTLDVDYAFDINGNYLSNYFFEYSCKSVKSLYFNGIDILNHPDITISTVYTQPFSNQIQITISVNGTLTLETATQSVDVLVETYEATPIVNQFNRFYFPMISRNHDFVVDWGDGTTETYVSSDPDYVISNGYAIYHDYQNMGTYQVFVDGVFEDIYSDSKNSEVLKSIPVLRSPLKAISLSYGANTYGEEFIKLDQPLDHVVSSDSLFSHVNSWKSNFTSFDLSACKNYSYMFYGSSNIPQSLLDSLSIPPNSSIGNMFSYTIFGNRTINDLEVSITENYVSLPLYLLGQKIYKDYSLKISYDQLFSDSTINENLTKWNISQTFQNDNTYESVNLGYIFHNCSQFNKPINWITFPVSTFQNKNINIGGMFGNATAFDQDLRHLRFDNVSYAHGFLDYTGMSVENYSNLLMWIAQHLDDSDKDLKTSVTFTARGVKRNANGTIARNRLVSEKNWSIVDGGEV